MILLSIWDYLTYFYSRPHGRGDLLFRRNLIAEFKFLLAPPREGRLNTLYEIYTINKQFLLAPPREGRPVLYPGRRYHTGDFYSRPHGRGDT